MYLFLYNHNKFIHRAKFTNNLSKSVGGPSKMIVAGKKNNKGLADKAKRQINELC